MSKPVHRLVIYRPKAGHHDQLLAILEKHGPALAKTGLITDDGVKLYRANDLRRHGDPEPYFIELFYWRDDKASDLAHQAPEIMSVWETMGPHMEGMTLTTLEPISQLDTKDKLEALEAVCAAIAHPARRQILLTVHLRGAMTAGDIAGRFAHAWPTTTRHLGVLVDAGLLVMERQGRNRVYQVSLERLAVLEEWLAWFHEPS